MGPCPLWTIQVRLHWGLWETAQNVLVGAKGHKHLSSSTAEGRDPQGTSILSCLWLRESLQRRVGELQVPAVGCHWQLGQ